MKMKPIVKKINKLNARFGIELNNDKVFEDFKNRVLLTVYHIAGDFILENYGLKNEWDKIFPKEVSIVPAVTESMQEGARVISDYLEIDRIVNFTFASTVIYKDFKDTKEFSHLITYLQTLLYLLEEFSFTQMLELNARLQENCSYSHGINISIQLKGQTITLYPKGASLLDEKLVSDVLEWLEDYPSVYKHFSNALKIYYRDDKSNYRHLLDELRVSIENLLRKILGNKKSLENQKQLLADWLKGKNIHNQVANMYGTFLFGQYSNYQNNAIKHGEEFSENEFEFMIYQTGIFMRLMIQLEKRHPTR